MTNSATSSGVAPSTAARATVRNAVVSCSAAAGEEQTTTLLEVEHGGTRLRRRVVEHTEGDVAAAAAALADVVGAQCGAHGNCSGSISRHGLRGGGRSGIALRTASRRRSRWVIFAAPGRVWRRAAERRGNGRPCGNGRRWGGPGGVVGGGGGAARRLAMWRWHRQTYRRGEHGRRWVAVRQRARRVVPTMSCACPRSGRSRSSSSRRGAPCCRSARRSRGSPRCPG